MNRLTFYKLISKYPEDYTKNCGLTGEEIDNNFFNLKSQDIKNAYWDSNTKTLVLERTDGTLINVNGIVDGLDNLIVNYDDINGILHITSGSHTYDISGFITSDMINKDIYTDASLNGNGTSNEPLVLSPLMYTGKYKPAIRLIDIINGENLPDESQLTKGDRYITIERISNYGLLYDFNSVNSINDDLISQSSEWRIPSKNDWDSMLNAIEECPEYKNHNSTSTSRALGYLAGKLLKSKNDWTLECYECENCEPSEEINPYPNIGIDKYGFNILPTGYGDGCGIMNYFLQRTAFWTSSSYSQDVIYIKRFDYDKSNVYQETVSSDMLLSLRLVKDYNGHNFFERENINGVDYTCVLMPTSDGSFKVWTVENINFTNPKYCGVEPNSGYSLSFSNKYFINEWDGEQWLKCQLKENESIVLSFGPNNEKSQEWMVINGVLTSVNNMIYTDVMAQVDDELIKLHDKINEEIDRATEAENTIANNLQNEANRATEAENTIANNLQNEVNRATEAENTIANNLQNEANRAIEAENTIANNLQNEANRATEAENTIANNLQNEVNRATEAENTIANNLQNEINRATEAENTIANNLQNEINNRFDNDIKQDEVYVLNAIGGLILKLNNGNNIVIKQDSNYGTY